MIRIDHIWLGVEPVDMRSGMDRLLMQVVAVFGRAQPHHAYLFANRRGTRMKVLIHDGFGIWMAVRRLHQGQFAWPTLGSHVNLSVEQACALVVGLPWQRMNADGSLSVL
ncbi:IS66 family insertion sequence element accessory protein TnpB [Pseudomonas sp. S 311-6]|uniref:IS66 family insertion sequence element accessory protein TnpB n=1 Tax=Kerstersia gyiorum TaxID=206506 RepID=UPI0020985BDD|nr:IS66 family insertion sequence element accessory protein TnpB [Pseudomonas sp. S 311-6]